MQMVGSWVNKERTFQKGFSQYELEKLVKLVLGKEFKVEKIPSKYKIEHFRSFNSKNKRIVYRW